MLRCFCLCLCSALVMIAAPGASATGLKRCTDLVAFFDRWGTSRSEHTDGARNHSRIRASLECEQGDHQAGIARMEALLLNKNFEVPVEVGEAPLYYPSGDVAETGAGR